MSDSAKTLPKFRKPPVIEVAISVQFKEIAKIGAPHLGMLWAERYRERYSKATQQPPLPNLHEAFPPTPARALVEIQPKMPVPRCWFLNEQGTELIQVQADRFVLNWRKLDTDQAYPSYELIKERFTEEVSKFEEWLKAEGFGRIKIDQSELTYVNHILEGEGWSSGNEIGSVVTLWSGSTCDEYLPEPEVVRFATQHVMPVAEKPMGRLYIRAETARRVSDDRRLIKLSLIGRGPSAAEDVEGAMTIMDHAHEWIVRSFASITSTEMHKRWERIQ
jgi:uncharacterized protein (TIGR04255 family)